MANKRKFEIGDIAVHKKTGLRGKIIKYSPWWDGYEYTEKSLYTIKTKYGEFRFNSNKLDRINKPGRVKVYGAGAWFHPKQAEVLNRMYSVIREFEEIDLFSPKDEVLVMPDASAEDRQKAFEADIKAIDTCNVVIASTEMKDMGTLFEIGYAYGHDVPVIYYAELPKGASFNLMLAGSGVAVATNPDELRTVIQHFKDNNWDFSKKLPYTGNIE